MARIRRPDERREKNLRRKAERAGLRLERSRALRRYALFCMYSDQPCGPNGSGEHVLTLDDVERWIDAGEDVGAYRKAQLQALVDALAGAGGILGHDETNRQAHQV